MNTCLVYPTSREYWFNDRLRAAFPYRPIAGPPKMDAPSGLEWHRTATGCQKLGLSIPVHVLITDKGLYRRPNEYRVVHQVSHVLSEDMVGLIGRGLYVESPEMMFVSAASSLSMAKLVQFGCELCGSFGFDAGQVGGVTYREAIATPKSLKNFAEGYTRLKGSAAVRKAINLGCVLSGARSPKEVTLMLLLCLPNRYGGYGLPLPELNAHIEIPYRDKKVIAQDYFVGDLVWERNGMKVIVEYDSKAAHEDKYDRDKNRVGNLNYMGYDVISVTPRILFNQSDLEKVALRVARSLGVRIRREHLGSLQARSILRRELLGDDKMNVCNEAAQHSFTSEVPARPALHC